MHPDAMIRALAVFPELSEIATELAPFWHKGDTEIALADLSFQLIEGDARTTVPDWTGISDAWFLDGFSPAKNPELWQPELMHQICRHTVPGGTAATYSAAGFVRRGLQDAGFTVERRTGYGRKRHMTVATKPPGTVGI